MAGRDGAVCRWMCVSELLGKGVSEVMAGFGLDGGVPVSVGWNDEGVASLPWLLSLLEPASSFEEISTHKKYLSICCFFQRVFEHYVFVSPFPVSRGSEVPRVVASGVSHPVLAVTRWQDGENKKGSKVGHF